MLFLMSLPIAGKLLWDKAVEVGISAGINAYHGQCLVGGIIINAEGYAIMCKPLAKIPKEELPNFTDNAQKLHY